ncbi:MAG: modification methylase PaeR7I, partial [Oceanospirillales bacterium]|nr:modification methylase PaeR7I [Oceanospirillales bacterium]
MNEQLSFLNTSELQSESATWGASDSEKGEIFTRPEVVSFMLTTAGLPRQVFTPGTRILEPSCGHGEFVVAIAELLSQEIQANCDIPSVDDIKAKVVAYELVSENVKETKAKVEQVLTRHYSVLEARSIADSWLTCGDFLLADVRGSFSHVVGNPPYIRVENIPKPILSEYRNRFSTMTDRADIYIAFFEKSLRLLQKNGRFSFICTDRWMKNRYGRALRELIDSQFNLDLYVDLYGKEPFQTKVMTYPAITLISHSQRKGTAVVHDPRIDNTLAMRVIEAMESGKSKNKDITIRKNISDGNQPWLFGSPDELSLIQRIETNFHLIEDAGCKVYIGAATGNNKVFIVDEYFDVEDDRKIPLITSSDIKEDNLNRSTKCIINTYDKNGVINLDCYPKLKRYLESNKEALMKRHVAKLSPKSWFKTIDRVYPDRANREKLLIPDIKSEFTVIYDEGVY